MRRQKSLFLLLLMLTICIHVQTSQCADSIVGSVADREKDVIWHDNAKATGKEKESSAEWRETVANISDFDFANARKKVEQEMEKSPDNSLRKIRAAFVLAICKQQIVPHTPELINEADELYKMASEKIPESEIAAYATLHRGRIAELIDYAGDKPNLARARKFYIQVIENFKGQPVEGEAVFRLAGSYVQTYKNKDVITGINILEEWLLENPDSLLASPMWQYIGDSYYFPLKEYGKSLLVYEEADKIGLIDEARKGETYWRMAVLADRYLKDKQRAVRFYTKIIEVTPTSGKAYEAQQALRRLGAFAPEISILNHIRPDTGKGAEK